MKIKVEYYKTLSSGVEEKLRPCSSEVRFLVELIRGYTLYEIEPSRDPSTIAVILRRINVELLNNKLLRVGDYIPRVVSLI